MYFRTTQRKNRDGSYTAYYQLAHNYRHPDSKNSTPEVIYNFGRADKLDRESLARLCRSIARVCNLEVRDPLEEGDAPNKDWPKGLKQNITRQLGAVWAISAIWERLEIGPTLRKAEEKGKCKVPYERAIFAMTANRLCEPESKLGVWDRWLPKVHLPSCWGLKLAQMYEAMDLLYENVQEIEKAVFFKTADLLNLEVDLIFYDTTTVSCQIDYEDEDLEDEAGLRKRGRSKDGTWTPQIIVALAVTREGLPVRSWVFPGNTSDVTTIAEIRKDLKGWQLGRCLFVGDSGMNSEESRRELARACGKYLLAVKVGTIKEVKEKVLTQKGRYREVADNLHIKEVEVGDGELRRRYVLCYNPKEAMKQGYHRDQVIAELDEELGQHTTRSATAKWAIALLASKRYGRYLTITKQSEVVIDKNKIAQAGKLDGKWVLLTNDDTLGAEDLACGYKGLMIIERCFRNLKSAQIEVNPMHHWLPHRIKAHVKICVLSLLIERVAEISCKMTWSEIQVKLDKMQASEYEIANHKFYRRNELSKETSEVLNKLSISPPRLILDISGE